MKKLTPLFSSFFLLFAICLIPTSGQAQGFFKKLKKTIKDVKKTKADIDHTLSDVKYTKAEVDTLLSINPKSKTPEETSLPIDEKPDNIILTIENIDFKILMSISSYLKNHENITRVKEKLKANTGTIQIPFDGEVSTLLMYLMDNKEWNVDITEFDDHFIHGSFVARS